MPDPSPLHWHVGSHRCDLSTTGRIMGILNTTPDSFSDGGNFDSPDPAIAHGLQMISDGAEIIDIGGESTRPGAPEVSAEDEISRVLPAITALHSQWGGPLSIDTSKASVARAAIDAGASIINDVTGFRGDPDMIDLAARTDAGLVVMHMQGNPREMQKAPHYEDVVSEVLAFFEERLSTLQSAGIAPERIAIDPGIGFGKTPAHNLSLLKHLDRFTNFGFPLLLGVSRKSLFQHVLGTESIEARLWPTVALTSLAREKGATLFRVHDVLPNFQALRMTEAIIQPAP